jgi:hypothetical protein
VIGAAASTRGCATARNVDALADYVYSPAHDQFNLTGVYDLAKPNYSFEKRQRELLKKQKKEAKRKKKAEADLPATPTPAETPARDPTAS